MLARGGDRRCYRPLESCLGGRTVEPLDDPVRLAVRYAATLDPAWIYVADLDRIEGSGDQTGRLAAIADAAPRSRLLWDGGFADGALQVTPSDRIVPILASETLRDPAGLQAGRPSEAWVGIDLTHDGMRAIAPAVADLGEVGLLERAVETGLTGAVVVFVDGVGSGAGLPFDRLARLRAAAPRLPILAGGGIGGRSDLRALRDLGFDGALVASALHDGRLTPAMLQASGYLRSAAASTLGARLTAPRRSPPGGAARPGSTSSA